MVEQIVLFAVAGLLAAAAVGGWYVWRFTAGYPKDGAVPRIVRWPAWRPAIGRPVPDIERRLQRWPATNPSTAAADRFMINPPSLRRYGERRAGRLGDKRPTGPGSDRIGLNRADRRYSADRKEARDDGWRSGATGHRGLRARLANVMAGVRGYCNAETCRDGERPGRSRRGEVRSGEDQLHLALRAILVHTPQVWPGGVYCGNDRSPFPCRMRHWGEQTLLLAGWDMKSIALMERQRRTALPPWLAGTRETLPPAS
jgi:hypothetical protein